MAFTILAICFVVAFITLLALVLSLGFFGIIPCLVASIVCTLIGYWFGYKTGGKIGGKNA